MNGARGSAGAARPRGASHGATFAAALHAAAGSEAGQLVCVSLGRGAAAPAHRRAAPPGRAAARRSRAYTMGSLTLCPSAVGELQCTVIRDSCW
jgi:hypothetical protein